MMKTLPIVGVRAWSFFDDTLRPAHYRCYQWNQEGPTAAKCPQEHEPPQRSCGCGMHAYADLGRAYREARYVSGEAPTMVGLVLAWGDIVPHGNPRAKVHGWKIEGFRATYMRPVAFLRPIEVELGELRIIEPQLRARELEEQLVAIAKRLGAPILDSDDQLRRIAKKLVDDGLAQTIEQAWSERGLVRISPTQVVRVWE